MRRIWEMAWRLNLEQRNEEGKIILYMARASDLALVSTFFTKSPEQTYIYKSGQNRTMIDCIVMQIQSTNPCFFLVFWRFALTKRASSETLNIFLEVNDINVFKNWYYSITIHFLSVSIFHSNMLIYGGNLSRHFTVK